MTKEQIIKALECCGNKACEDCPTKEMDRCVTILLKNTIAFTRELLEENEKLKRALDDKFGNWLKLYDATEKYHSELFKEAKIAVKEDTVRKMQSEIEARCIEKGIYPVIVKRVVDEVAKELLEGKSDAE